MMTSTTEMRELEFSEIDAVSGASLDGFVRDAAGGLAAWGCSLLTKNVAGCIVFGAAVANVPPMQGHASPRPVSYGV